MTVPATDCGWLTVGEKLRFMNELPPFAVAHSQSTEQPNNRSECELFLVHVLLPIPTFTKADDRMGKQEMDGTI